MTSPLSLKVSTVREALPMISTYFSAKISAIHEPSQKRHQDPNLAFQMTGSMPVPDLL